MRFDILLLALDNSKKEERECIREERTENMEPGNPASTPDPESPTSPSAGFNTDQLPHTSRASEDDEASVDPDIIRDEPEEENPEEDEDGEDLYNDNFMESVPYFSAFFLLNR